MSHDDADGLPKLHDAGVDEATSMTVIAEEDWIAMVMPMPSKRP